MIRDAIIDEVRTVRDAIAREHHFDLDSIFQALRDREAMSHRPHVTLPPKRLDFEGAATPVSTPPEGSTASGTSRRT